MTEKRSPSPEHLARANAAAAELPLLRNARFQLLAQADGKARATIEVTPEVSALSHHLNGGDLYGLLDCIAWYAVVPLLAEDEAAVSHDAHFSILGTAPRGRTVELSAEVSKRGRTTVFVRSEATLDGKTVALATVTKSVIPMSVRTRHSVGSA